MAKSKKNGMTFQKFGKKLKKRLKKRFKNRVSKELNSLLNSDKKAWFYATFDTLATVSTDVYINGFSPKLILGFCTGLASTILLVNPANKIRLFIYLISRIFFFFPHLVSVEKILFFFVILIIWSFFQKDEHEENDK